MILKEIRQPGYSPQFYNICLLFVSAFFVVDSMYFLYRKVATLRPQQVDSRPAWRLCRDRYPFSPCSLFVAIRYAIVLGLTITLLGSWPMPHSTLSGTFLGGIALSYFILFCFQSYILVLGFSTEWVSIARPESRSHTLSALFGLLVAAIGGAIHLATRVLQWFQGASATPFSDVVVAVLLVIAVVLVTLVFWLQRENVSIEILRNIKRDLAVGNTRPADVVKRIDVALHGEDIDAVLAYEALRLGKIAQTIKRLHEEFNMRMQAAKVYSESRRERETGVPAEEFVATVNQAAAPIAHRAELIYYTFVDLYDRDVRTSRNIGKRHPELKSRVEAFEQDTERLRDDLRVKTVEIRSFQM